MAAHVDSASSRAMCPSRAWYFRGPRSFLVCVLSLWLTLSAAHALDPNKRLTQYAHTAWRIQDGFFPNTPSWISQTKDGYLWVGGNSGALRFDGVRFTPWSAPVASTPIFHPVSVRAGEYWIATRNEFAHIRDNVVISHYDVPIIRIYKDSDGSVWTLSHQDSDRILCHATDTEIRCFGKAEGIKIGMPSSFIPDGNGGFWIGGDTSLLHWKMGAAPAIYSFQQLQSNVGQIGIRSLVEESDGSLLIGIVAAGPGLGLERFRNGVLTPVVLPNFDGSKLVIYKLMEDSDKSLWIATVGNGIYRIHGQTVDHFGRADGLSSDTVSDLYEGDDGVVWAATSDGIDNFRDLPVATFSNSTGPGLTGTASVMAAKDGTVWVATLGALDFVRNGAVSSVRVPGQQVSSLLEDHEGNIWVGVDDELFIYQDGHNNHKDGRFRRITEPDHHPLGLVLGLTEDVDGNVWAECKGAQNRRLLRIHDFKVREEFSQPQVPKAKAIAADPKGGIWLGAVTGELTFFRDGIARTSPLKLKRGSWAYQIAVAPDGSVMTASDDGLVMLRAGNVQHLGKENGLPCDGVNGFVVDDNKNLWLNTPCGFIEIAALDVQRWWTHPDTMVQARQFDTLDGARPGRVSFNPAAKSPDGRLWFVNGTVLQMIDPSHLPGDGTVSPVYVESVVADRKQYKPQEGLQLPCLTRDLQIGYTSPSFLIPQKVKFRYRLDGQDRDWQDAGTRREAFYTDLGPGKYRFHVIASNDSGVWNEQGATLDFAIAPAFYQTVWFQVLGVCLFLVVLTGLFRLRIRRLEHQRDALRKSEKELRDVIDTIPATVWSTLPDGSNTYVNRHTVEYQGLSAEQMAGSGWQAVIHPDDLARHLGKWTEAIATGKPLENEVRLRRSDGQYRWHLDRGVPLRDEDGNIVKWYGVVTDIEDRKSADEALQRSQFYISEGQRVAHMGSWAFNADGFEYWSSELFRIYGLDPDGKPPTVEEYLALVHPEDRAFMKQGIAKMLDDHLAFDFTKRIARPDGEIRHVRCVGVPVTQGGIFHGFLGTGMDVTEQERLTDELRLSERYLSEGQRLARMGSWAFNPAGFFYYWSEELFRIYGLDPQKGAPTLERYLATIHPQDRDSMANTLKRMCAEHSGCDEKKRIVRPDGELRYIRCVGIAIVEGEILKGFLGTAMDITEQELLTQELERQQAYLAEAQKLTHTASWAWRVSDRRTVHLSGEFYRIYGFDPAQGAPTWEAYSKRVHPEDRLKWRGEVERVIAGKADYDHEFRILLPNGKVKWIRTVGHPVFSDAGDLEGFVGSSTDITERKSAEQALQRSESYLAEAQRLSHTGSWAWNPASGNTYYSEECYRVLGLAPGDGTPPPLETILQRIHPDDQAQCRERVEKAIHDKVDFVLDYRIVHPDKRVRDIHCVCHAALDRSGDLVELVGTVIDVTELKSAEEEHDKLRQLEAALAHINRVSMLGEMAASLAHEIKQPIAAAITSANTCVEWLAHEPPNLDRARAAAARIDKYGHRAAEIIDRIRSFYRKSPPQRESVDVNEIIQEIFTLLKGEATRSSIAMHTNLSTELPKIMVDRVQLQQVFMNLMLNGIEAMENSGGELAVQSELRDGQLQFSVSDTGTGLPAEMDQIFSAFFTTKPRGSGMGLAISRSIVESHGGRLWATANGGRGATFHFTLPTQVPHSAPVVA
jgi:PAS domain S-box-containing protein